MTAEHASGGLTFVVSRQQDAGTKGLVYGISDAAPKRAVRALYASGTSQGISVSMRACSSRRNVTLLA